MTRTLWLLFFVGSALTLGAQTQTRKSDSRFSKRKGKIFLYYGWNRSAYSTSDIYFTGSGYNFKLNNVVAHDKPTHFDPKVYFNPGKITIPQYQYRFGYYLSDKYSVSWGFNHMKYVMQPNQTVKITGTINTPEAGSYNGTYQNQDIVVAPDFLQFEHTNGLNYLDFNFDRTETLWVGRKDRFSLNAIGGFGAGILYPKSDVTLFGKRQDKWHLAGFGMSSHIALRFEFFRNMFIQAQFEGGFIDMPDILTTGDFQARARQHFFYTEETVVIGGYLKMFQKK